MLRTWALPVAPPYFHPVYSCCQGILISKTYSLALESPLEPQRVWANGLMGIKRRFQVFFLRSFATPSLQLVQLSCKWSASPPIINVNHSLVKSKSLETLSFPNCAIQSAGSLLANRNMKIHFQHMPHKNVKNETYQLLFDGITTPIMHSLRRLFEQGFFSFTRVGNSTAAALFTIYRFWTTASYFLIRLTYSLYATD